MTSIPHLKQGIIDSINESQKSAFVEIKGMVKHPLYHKRIKRSQYLRVHTHDFKLHIGQKVDIKQCRKYSKTKSWEIIFKDKVS